MLALHTTEYVCRSVISKLPLLPLLLATSALSPDVSGPKDATSVSVDVVASGSRTEDVATSDESAVAAAAWGWAPIESSGRGRGEEEGVDGVEGREIETEPSAEETAAAASTANFGWSSDCIVGELFFSSSLPAPSPSLTCRPHLRPCVLLSSTDAANSCAVLRCSKSELTCNITDAETERKRAQNVFLWGGDVVSRKK